MDQLWTRFKPILQQAEDWNLGGITDSEVKGIESYIRQLHEIDENSYNFRYETTTKGEPSIPDKERFSHYINIKLFAESMETLATYLFGIGEVFHDSFQIKCEMEAEAQADFYQDYSY
ncbi:MAG: hypothetical protein ABSH28_17180 [Acidobacteriota bacterium]